MCSGLKLLALMIALGLAAPATVAADQQTPHEAPGELAREGVEKLMQALRAVIEKIPQYEMPEINEQGDIIIRRRRAPEKAKPSDPEVDATDT